MAVMSGQSKSIQTVVCGGHDISALTRHSRQGHSRVPRKGRNGDQDGQAQDDPSHSFDPRVLFVVSLRQQSPQARAPAWFWSALISNDRQRCTRQRARVTPSMTVHRRTRRPSGWRRRRSVLQLEDRFERVERLHDGDVEDSQCEEMKGCEQDVSADERASAETNVGSVLSSYGTS